VISAILKTQQHPCFPWIEQISIICVFLSPHPHTMTSFINTPFVSFFNRNVSKSLLYDNGINGTPLNFLFTEWEQKTDFGKIKHTPNYRPYKL
jgi:hypothetical protein